MFVDINEELKHLESTKPQLVDEPFNKVTNENHFL